MPTDGFLTVLIAQSDASAAESLAGFFQRRGDRVWQATMVAEVAAFMDRDDYCPDLALIDLHFPNDGWQEALTLIRKKAPARLRRGRASKPHFFQMTLRRPWR